MVAVFLITKLLYFGLTANAQSNNVVFQCESQYEGVKINFKATKERATALYATSGGKTYVCEAPILFLDLGGAQIPHYEANLLFTEKCHPKLSSDLSKMISVEMKLNVPISKDSMPKISWINYRRAQNCIPLINLLGDHFKKK